MNSLEQLLVIISEMRIMEEIVLVFLLSKSDRGKNPCRAEKLFERKKKTRGLITIQSAIKSRGRSGDLSL